MHEKRKLGCCSLFRGKNLKGDLNKMGQTQGRELPYDIGERFTSLTSKTIWSVHAGKKKVRMDLHPPVDSLA